MKQLVIKISPEGIINAETINMKGHECQKYVSVLEELTESMVVESSYKEEFYHGTGNILNDSVEEESYIESSVNQ